MRHLTTILKVCTHQLVFTSSSSLAFAFVLNNCQLVCPFYLYFHSVTANQLTMYTFSYVFSCGIYYLKNFMRNYFSCMVLFHFHPVCTNVLSKEQIQDLVSMGYPGPPTVLDGKSVLLSLLTFYSSSVPLTTILYVSSTRSHGFG